MKTLPPELIDGIIALLSAAVGWFGRWLQGREKIKKIEREATKAILKMDEVVTHAEKSRDYLAEQNTKLVDQINKRKEFNNPMSKGIK